MGVRVPCSTWVLGVVVAQEPPKLLAWVRFLQSLLLKGDNKMANLEYLKFFEQEMDKSSFVPKRNIYDYVLIHNSKLEEEFSDSNDDQNKNRKVYASIDYSYMSPEDSLIAVSGSLVSPAPITWGDGTPVNKDATGTFAFDNDGSLKNFVIKYDE